MPAFIDLFNTFFPYGFLKLMVVIIALLYVLFAAVIVRQEELMGRVVEIPFSPVLRTVVIAHLVIALVVLIASLFLL
ncbi:hypothetical protein C4579_01520 [Candidatus Microgenomates bacterium]|nr:MAG: hypothetical protein C4579_01520 [Candidatus Microgenomates bacterium]